MKKNFYTNAIAYGNNILLREFDYDLDKTVSRKIPFEPSLFVPSSEPSKYKTIHGENVKRLSFDSIRKAKETIEKYKGLSGFRLEGNQSWQAQFLVKEYPTSLEFDFKKITVFNIDIEIDAYGAMPDIEQAEREVTAITIHHSRKNMFYTWGCGKYIPSDDSLKNVVYQQCDSEEEMLQAFISFWESDFPDVITGWNIDFFDVPYLINRIKRLFGQPTANRLSPWHRIVTKTIRGNFGNEQIVHNINGVSSLDYIQLYKQYTYSSKESYSLEFIGNLEVGSGKIKYEGSLNDLYESDFSKYIDYNIKDVDLVKRIDDKMKLLDLVFTLSYYARQNFQDTHSPVKTWENIIYSHLKSKNIVLPARTFDNCGSIVGGYVKEPKVGFSDWVVSFDLASLYPSIIRQYNIGPETLLPEDELTPELISIRKSTSDLDQFISNVIDNKLDLSAIKPANVSLTASGEMYCVKEQSFLSELMEKLYLERKADKKTMMNFMKKKEAARTSEFDNQIAKYNNLQMAKKIALNACYGALANDYFLFNDRRLAESVTKTGQLVIQYIAAKLNNHINNKIVGSKDHDYVIAIDTDSVYLELVDIVEMKYGKDYKEKGISSERIVDFLDKFSKSIFLPFISKNYDALFDYTNGREPLMIMERESIASRGIWTSKKRYVLDVYDSEGVRFKKPKLKKMGLEIVKSSTPSFCRKYLETAAKLMLRESEKQLQEFVVVFKKMFNAAPLEEIAYPRGCNNLEKYDSGDSSIYVKGTPKHVKAALTYNYWLEKMGLGDKYRSIQSGNKIKYVDLVVPNPFKVEVMAFPADEHLPPEFDIKQYINYNLLFEKTFLKPLQGMLNVINWQDKKKTSLEDFFS